MSSPAGVSATTTAEHSVTLTLCITGPRANVLSGLDAILSIIEEMHSEVMVDLTTNWSAQQIATLTSEPEEWPRFRNQVLSFRGKETALKGKGYAAFFQSIWEARGQIVSQEHLESLFSDLKTPSNGVHTTAYRVRAILAEQSPEIELEHIGDGYRLVIKD